MDHCRDLAYQSTVGVSVLQTSLCAPLKSTCLYQLEDGTQQEESNGCWIGCRLCLALHSWAPPKCAFPETTIGNLIRVLLIGRAALHLLRSIDLAWPSISGPPSTDEFLLSYADLPG